MSAESATTAWVGLGSNLGDPVRQLRAALGELGALPATRLVAASRLYRNPPMGPPGQPDYVNAVARLDTGLEPLALLDGLQAIEAAHGRRREGPRWAARTLDLDVLLYGDRRLAEPRLTVPHPGLPERAFVLYPLAELAPGLAVPGLGTVAELLRDLPPGRLEPVDEEDTRGND